LNTYSLFCVFDGHNGAAAAKFAANRVLPMLEERLPKGPVPPLDHPLSPAFRELIQCAVVETTIQLNREYAARGIMAGCTSTVVLVVDRLVTCVNLGDSRATIDNGLDNLVLTVDHRVATFEADRERVEEAGAQVASLSPQGNGPAESRAVGVGPLRIWPGGLCLSRAVGDFDVGDVVIPLPHLTQVVVPKTGARLMMGSDGVWEAYENMTRVQATSRSWNLDFAPSRVIQAVVRGCDGLRDDTSLIVVDVTPVGMTFPECAAAAKTALKKSKSSGSMNSQSSMKASSHVATDAVPSGGCLCFGGGGGGGGGAPRTANTDSSVDRSASVKKMGIAAESIRVVADVDIAQVCGLLPSPRGMPAFVPGWLMEESVKDAFLEMAAEANEIWREAHFSSRFIRPSQLLNAKTDASNQMKSFREQQSMSYSSSHIALHELQTDVEVALLRRSMDYVGADGKVTKIHYIDDDIDVKGKLPSMIDASVRIGKKTQVQFTQETERDMGIADRVVSGGGPSVRASNGAANALAQARASDPDIRMVGSAWGDKSVHMKVSKVPSRDPSVRSQGTAGEALGVVDVKKSCSAAGGGDGLKTFPIISGGNTQDSSSSRPVSDPVIIVGGRKKSMALDDDCQGGGGGGGMLGSAKENSMLITPAQSNEVPKLHVVQRSGKKSTGWFGK